MKKLLIFLILTVPSLCAHAQYFQWAHELYYTNRSANLNANAVDHFGNVISVGFVQNCQICVQLVVRKEDPSGNLIWQYAVNPSGGNGTAFANQLAVDYEGNAYVTGGLSAGYLVFGTDTCYGANFLFRLNVSGVPTWAIDNIDGQIASDSVGSVYITNGSFTRKYNKHKVFQWENRSLPGVTDIAVDNVRKAYIISADSTIKFDAYGNVLLATNIGANRIAISPTGSPFLLTSNSLRKIKGDGTVLWTNNTVGGSAFSVDNNGACYIINGTSVQKINTSGTAVAWTRSSENAPFNSIAVDANKNVYLCGNYDALTIAKLCPFKLFHLTWQSFGNQLCFTAKINSGVPAPFQAGIFTGKFGIGNDPWLCNYTPYSIPYSTCLSDGSNWGPTNQFRAQISNDDFASNIVDIGPANAAVIPGSVAEGTSYRIRVVSTDPVVIGYPNESSLLQDYVEVRDKSLSISATGSSTFCSGDSVKLTATAHPTGSYTWFRNGNFLASGVTQIYAKQTGSYTCSYFNATCDTTSNPVQVTVRAKPAANINPSTSQSICAGDSVVLTASAGGGYFYQWRKNNVNIAQATQQTYAAKQAGTYKVRVTNSFGCTRISPGVSVSVPCRENGEPVEREESISVYPSPVSDVLYLHIQNYTGTGFIYVINTLGQNVYTKEISFENSVEKTVDMTLFSAGIYSVIVKDENTVHLIKVLKE